MRLIGELGKFRRQPRSILSFETKLSVRLLLCWIENFTALIEYMSCFPCQIKFQGFGNINVEMYDCLRGFSGDGLARQYETGQQRGGNYSCVCGVKTTNHTNLITCYNVEALSLDERSKLATTTRSIEILKEGNLYPMKNLKKIRNFKGIRMQRNI